MKVINCWGGPCSGKSVLAAEIFVYLKKNQIPCELVTEYAKDCVYDQRQNILNDQLYILSKQNRKIARLEGKGLDYVVTDSPILLGNIYYKATSTTFPQLVFETFNQYNNINFFISRLNVPYQTYGRQQNYDEACKIDFKILEMLKFYNVKYTVITGEDKLEQILKELKIERVCS